MSDFLVDNSVWSHLAQAAGAIDIMIAGYAIANDAIVLAADHDYGHIAAVSDLQQEYIAPSRCTPPGPRSPRRPPRHD